MDPPGKLANPARGQLSRENMDPLGKRANPARGQLNVENEYFPVPART